VWWKKNNILYVILRSCGKWFVSILLSCKFSRRLRGDFVVQIYGTFDYSVNDYFVMGKFLCDKIIFF